MSTAWLGLRTKRARFCDLVAARRQVELASLLRHLRGSNQPIAIVDADRALDAELSEVGVEIETGGKLLTRPVGAVLFSFGCVFVGDCILAEIHRHDLLHEPSRKLFGARRKIGTATSGNAIFTASRSAGLSSIKTKLSVPRLRSLAMWTMFCTFGDQLMDMAAKSPRRSTIILFRSKTSMTSASLFLLAIASRTPVRVAALMQR